MSEAQAEAVEIPEEHSSPVEQAAELIEQALLGGESPEPEQEPEQAETAEMPEPEAEQADEADEVEDEPEGPEIDYEMLIPVGVTTEEDEDLQYLEDQENQAAFEKMI